MTIKSRVEKLAGQILPPGWLERLEHKLIIGTISDGELEKLEGYYRHVDPEGMKAIDAQVSAMTDAKLDEFLSRTLPLVYQLSDAIQ